MDFDKKVSINLDKGPKKCSKISSFLTISFVNPYTIPPLRIVSERGSKKILQSYCSNS